MKLYDDVKVINDNEQYQKEGVYKGMIGYIVMAEIRSDCFYICFIDENFEKHRDDYDWFRIHIHEIKDDIFCEIKIADLELVKDGGTTDEEILEELPKNDPRWWCKVENGYIMNLLGDKKNKIPYDYYS